MRVKFGNTTKDVSILEVTPENYIVPKGEEGVYHCRIEQKSFNASTGERQSRPRIQKFEPKMWPMLCRNLKLQGWTVEVMHDPTEWIKQQEEKAAMTEAERIKQRTIEKVTGMGDQLVGIGKEFTIYEGDWDKYYAARLEIWFVPANGGKPRKLKEKLFRVQGWMF